MSEFEVSLKYQGGGRNGWKPTFGEVSNGGVCASVARLNCVVCSGKLLLLL